MSSVSLSEYLLSIALCFWKAKTPKRRKSIDLGIPYTELTEMVLILTGLFGLLVTWCGAISAKMVEALYNMPKVELKFDHINGNGCGYGPPYECQLASLLRAGVMDLI
ncbi:hypothetical protein MKW92_001171 [Papaver armeniacum]|nr:hypothetical protein MKW92_001171 [Papaver armeniacum]